MMLSIIVINPCWFTGGWGLRLLITYYYAEICDICTHKQYHMLTILQFSV